MMTGLPSVRSAGASSNAWPGPAPACSGRSAAASRDRVCSAPERKRPRRPGELSFVQISDSHIGFGKPAEQGRRRHPDRRSGGSTGCEARRLADPHRRRQPPVASPASSTPRSRSDEARPRAVTTCPASTTCSSDGGQAFFERFTKGAARGWYSFDQQGVHFVGLNNVQNLKRGRPRQSRRGAARMAGEGPPRPSGSQPIVVFAHIPLWVGLPGMGLGHRRRDAGAQLPQALRLGHRAERAYPSGDAEGRGQRGVPYRALHRLPAACSRSRTSPWSDQGRAARQAARAAGRDAHPPGQWQRATGDRGSTPWRLMNPARSDDHASRHDPVFHHVDRRSARGRRSRASRDGRCDRWHRQLHLHAVRARGDRGDEGRLDQPR